MSWILKHRPQALALICGSVTVLVLLLYLVVYPSLVAGLLAIALGTERDDPNEPSAGEEAAAAFYQMVNWTAIRSVSNIELQTRDYRMRLGPAAPRHPDLIYLAVDEPSITLSSLWPEEIEASRALQLMKQGWPYNREVWAHVIDRLTDAGAKVVAFDFIYPTPNPGDAAFGDALERHRDEAVIGVDMVTPRGGTGAATTLQLPHQDLLKGIDALSEVYEDDRLGVINFEPDDDQVVRFARYRLPYGRGEFRQDFNHFATQIAEKAGFGQLIPAGAGMTSFRYAGPPATFEPNSLFEIFTPVFWSGVDEEDPGKYRDGEFFRDKIVVIGPEGHIFKDELLSPYGSMAGPEIHLNALNALLTGSFIGLTPWWLDMLFIALAGALAWALMYFFKTAWLAAAAFAICAFGYLAFSQFAYNVFDSYVLVFLPLANFLISGTAGLVAEFVAERMERNRTRSTLERFVARNIVKEVLENPDSFYNKLGGTRLPITVLFSDVRGFTTMTEESDPEQLVAQLNEYLRVMGDAVQVHNGILDKFIGDAVMATWGNINSEGYEADARLAVDAALEMRKRLAGLNAAWGALGWRTWQFGIGLHQGEAIVGSIGSDKIKQDPTVIGDTVNTGARMESSTKKYQVDLLVSDVMKPHLEGAYVLQSIDKVVFKGKTKAVETFTVIAAESAELDGPTRAYLAAYHEALETFRPPVRDFARARELFARAQEFRPNDHLCGLYMDRCRGFERNPPPADWQGEEVATSK
ncbi:MAG: adenylate/guanylate cyclase domain-containing protein [Verrucomicrobiota bacterium]